MYIIIVCFSFLILGILSFIIPLFIFRGNDSLKYFTIPVGIIFIFFSASVGFISFKTMDLENNLTTKYNQMAGDNIAKTKNAIIYGNFLLYDDNKTTKVLAKINKDNQIEEIQHLENNEYLKIRFLLESMLTAKGETKLNQINLKRELEEELINK